MDLAIKELASLRGAQRQSNSMYLPWKSEIASPLARNGIE
jgi:hypothetical protein